MLRMFRAAFLSLLCLGSLRADPIYDAYISTGDNHWLGSSLPIDSPQSIEDTFEFLQKVCGVQRVYWRGLEEATWVQTMIERPENCRYYSFWQWMRRLYREVDPDVLAVKAAKKRGIEIWGVGTLFDWGAQADTPGFGDYPANAESKLRLEHPEWVPVDKHGFRRQGGPIELAYPEARAALVKLHMDEALRAGYDSITFLTYVENYSLRFQDEFGYSPPIVEEFKKRHKLDITKEAFTRYASKEDWQRLRGEYVTTYLREMKTELAKHRKQLGIFISAHDIRKPQPWNVPELIRTSGMMHFDLETWAKDGLVDLFMVNGNSSGQMQDAAIREVQWLVRDTKTQLTFLTSSANSEKWKPLQDSGIRNIIALNEDAHFASRNVLPEQTTDALSSGDLARTCKALAQIIEGKLNAKIEQLNPLAMSGNLVQRRLALKALAHVQDTAALPIIESALLDPENGIRCMAAECLRAVHGEKSTKALLAAVEKFGTHPLRESAVPTLLRMKPFPRPLLQEAAMKSASEDVRIVCLRALATVAEAGDFPVFEAAFQKGSTYPRYLATEGMGNIRHQPDAVNALLRLLGHHDVVVANRAAASLAHMARTKNPALEPLHQDVITALQKRFADFAGEYLRPDAGWGWRVVGNALRDFGVPSPAKLTPHSFAVWHLPQKPATFSEVSEAENDAAFKNMPPPQPAARPPTTLLVDTTNGPFKTITAAVKAARPGDTILLTPGIYHESVDFTNRSGAPGRPIIVEGRGSTINGSDVVDLSSWESLGNDLYRKPKPATPKLVPEIISRFYLLFDGSIQRMGQCSKGKRAPLKKPADLAHNEWTYAADEDALYLRAGPGTKIEMPVRSNGLIVAGTCAHLVFRDLTATHVYNDGANIHGWCRDVVFENIRCIECGDDGVSAHDDCEIRVDGLISERNATGITDTGASVSHYRNVTIRDCVGYDLFFIGSNEHSVTDATIHSKAERTLVLDGSRDLPNGRTTLLLKNVRLLRAGTPQEIRVTVNSTLTMQNVETVNLSLIATGGSVHAHDCTFTGSPPSDFLLWRDATWTGEGNSFQLGSFRHDKQTFYPKNLAAFRAHFMSDRTSTWK